MNRHYLNKVRILAVVVTAVSLSSVIAGCVSVPKDKDSDGPSVFYGEETSVKPEVPDNDSGPDNVSEGTPLDVMQSTFTVIVEKPNGPYQGSGFLIGNDLVATNYHVVHSSNGGYVIAADDGTRYEIEGLAGAIPARDIAILQVSSAPIGRTVLDLAEDTSGLVGSQVYLLGSPMGLHGTVTEGIISADRHLTGQRYLQTTAPSSQGNSGGPLANSDGEVIGMAFSSVPEGQNLNFVIPAEDISAALSDTRENAVRLDRVAWEQIGETNRGQSDSGTADPRLSQVIVENTISVEITYVYLSPTDSSIWGTDVLGSNRVLEPGESAKFFVHHPNSCNAFDLMAVDETGNVYSRYGIRICHDERRSVPVVFQDKNPGAEFMPNYVRTTFENRISSEIYFLFVSPRDSNFWGVELLGQRHVLDPGAVKSLEIPVFDEPVYYDVMAIDETGQQYQFWIEVQKTAQNLRFFISRDYAPD